MLMQLIPIMRAGLVLLEQASATLPMSETYHVGLERDERTLRVCFTCSQHTLSLSLSLSLSHTHTHTLKHWYTRLTQQLALPGVSIQSKSSLHPFVRCSFMNEAEIQQKGYGPAAPRRRSMEKHARRTH